MKSKWEPPTAQKPICAFGDSHLASPPPKGSGGLCSYVCGVALTCLSGTGRSITWPRAAART
jgi:hypothetical protein